MRTAAGSFVRPPALILTLHSDSDRLARAIGRCLLLAIPWAGDLFRATAMEFATRRDLASGEGARKHGGRWTPKGGFPTVYGSPTAEAALAELLTGHRRRGLPDVQALPVAVVGLQASLQRVLDLSDGRVRQILGLSTTRMITESWERLQRRGREALTQAVGRLTRAAGLEGLRVPSAVPGAKDRNVVIFADQLLLGSWVKIVHEEQLGTRRRKNL